MLKEISPEYSLEGMMLKLRLQHFGHLIKRADSLEKILMLGKTEGKRRSGWQRMRWLDSITDSMDINLSKLYETVEYKVTCHAAVHWVTKSWTQLSNWTTTPNDIVFPRWLSSKESACQCRTLRKHVFNPWVRKISLEKCMATHFNILA